MLSECRGKSQDMYFVVDTSESLNEKDLDTVSSFSPIFVICVTFDLFNHAYIYLSVHLLSLCLNASIQTMLKLIV